MQLRETDTSDQQRSVLYKLSKSLSNKSTRPEHAVHARRCVVRSQLLLQTGVTRLLRTKLTALSSSSLLCVMVSIHSIVGI